MDLRPKHRDRYPAFSNGNYIEEYFYEFWQKQQFIEKTQFEYIDIFWNCLFHQVGVEQTVNHVKQMVIERCNIAREQGKVVFTICQWDDNICFGSDKPDNLIVYSSCHYDNVILPLNAEDVTQKLIGLPRKPFNEKDILCSFIGCYTHDVRRKIKESLDGKSGFYFIINEWSNPISEQASSALVNMTLRSKFGLAPRGYGVSSFRFFEIMQMGTIPVYVHDGIIGLPFMDILDYKEFAIVIHINDIDTLPDILSAIDEDKYNKMLREMEKVRLWFTMDGTCEYILQNLRSRLAK
jgi:hypothetical protein